MFSFVIDVKLLRVNAHTIHMFLIDDKSLGSVQLHLN